MINDRIIVSNGSKITLEMLHVSYIEPDDRGVGSDINFSELLAEHVWPAIDVDELLEFVESREDWYDVLVVDFLVRCEAGFVHAGVEITLHPLADGINLGTEFFGVEIQRPRRWENGIERCWQSP